MTLTRMEYGKFLPAAARMNWWTIFAVQPSQELHEVMSGLIEYQQMSTLATHLHESRGDLYKCKKESPGDWACLSYTQAIVIAIRRGWLKPTPLQQIWVERFRQARFSAAEQTVVERLRYGLTTEEIIAEQPGQERSRAALDRVKNLLSGIFQKTGVRSRLSVTAIALWAQGETVLPDAVRPFLPLRLLEWNRTAVRPSAAQLEIMSWTAQGLSRPEIARKTGMAEATISSHRTRMAGRLGGGQAIHQVAICTIQSWIEPPNSDIVAAYRALPPGTSGLHLLELSVLGYTHPEIAACMDLSPKRVYSRMKALHLHLGVSERTDMLGGIIAAADRLQLQSFVRERSDEKINETIPVLSGQERAVLTQIALGRTRQEVARALNLSIGTVDDYCLNISSKFNGVDRVKQVVQAIRYGLLSCPVEAVEAVLRFVQYQPSSSQAKVLELVKDGRWLLTDDIGLSRNVFNRHVRRMTGLFGGNPRSARHAYVAAIALWAEVGLGWSEVTEDLAWEWLVGPDASVIKSLQNRNERARQKMRVLRLLVEDASTAEIAGQCGWTVEATSRYLVLDLTENGRLNVCQVVDQAIRSGAMTAPFSYQATISQLRELSLNLSERKVLWALARTGNPLGVQTQLRLPPQQISFHLKRLHRKFETESTVKLVALAAWSDHLKVSPLVVRDGANV